MVGNLGFLCDIHRLVVNTASGTFINIFVLIACSARTFFTILFFICFFRHSDGFGTMGWDCYS